MKKLRVYYIILGAPVYYQKVKSPEEAKLVITSISAFVNQQVDNSIFPDHCSAAGLEYYDEEEKDWITWYDDDGLDFDAHFEEVLK